jgi:hypothetical protein
LRFSGLRKALLVLGQWRLYWRFLKSGGGEFIAEGRPAYFAKTGRLVR